MNNNENYENYLMEIEDEIMWTIRSLQNGTLVKCDACGNIWDGNAQCNCWQWNLDEELSETSDYDPMVYGADPVSVCDIIKLDN